ncbi:ankyrin, partial [Stipitochalara longipes BDJ]
CVKVLLENGANSNIKSASGWTPLLVGAGNGNTRIVRLLLQSKPKPNTEDTEPSGETALLRAAKRNHAQTVKALSDDANLEAQDKYGETALIVAARRWYKDTLRVLLDSNADVNTRDRFGDTALLKAAKLGRTGHHQVVELLLKRNAAVEATDCNEETALIRSVKRRHLLVISQLLGQGANIEAKDQYGDPPL